MMVEVSIGEHLNIVGRDMSLNQFGRREFNQEEYDFYDKKGKDFFRYVARINNWEIIKENEDYWEDFEIKVNGKNILIEVAVRGYWHNFHPESVLPSLHTEFGKVQKFQQKALETNKEAILVLMNCVPNQLAYIDFNDIELRETTQINKEKFIDIPLEKFSIDVYRDLFDISYRCDCLSNHQKFMRGSRKSNVFSEHNLYGSNRSCCP